MVLAEPVLVGRKNEIENLQSSWKSVQSGRGATILVSGEAGSGKTRLVNEFLGAIQKRDAKILSGWCLSKAALPYFPFIEAFSSDLPNRNGGAGFSQQLGMKSWLSEPNHNEQFDKNRVVAPQVWKDQAFAAVTRELLFMSSAKPLILVLEDMHWADSASLALLHYISRATTNEKILVLVTYRSEELGRDDEGSRHPLAETVQLMGREGLFTEVKLASLEQDDVKRIAESMLAGDVDAELVDRLVEESRGNPLFVVEFLRMLSEQGNLVQKGESWRLSVDRLGVPSKVRDIILRRIGALKVDQRRVLDVAAVIGDKFNPDLIGGVLSKDRLEILETLNDVLKSTSLVRVEENGYRFDHEKSREVLYEEISLPLKRGYHARIAEQTENMSQNGKTVSFSDLAYHYAQAGNNEKAVKYALAAGQDALSRFSNAEAIKHFKYVLQTISSLQNCSKERQVALEGLGDAYYASCLFEKAAKTFETLASSETGAVKLRAYRKEMDATWFIEYDSTHLMQLIKEAEKIVSSDRLERARFLWNRGRALVRLRDLKAALKDHEEALQIVEEECSLPDVALLLVGTGITRITCGIQHKKGLGELQRALALYQELGDVRGEVMAMLLSETGLQCCGLIEELGKVADAIKVGEEIGDFENMAQASIWRSGGFEVAGQFEEAITQNLKALEYSKKTETKRLQCEIFGGLTRQYSRIGDLKQASHYFDLLMKMPPEVRAFPRNAFNAVLAEAVLLAAKNQWKEANQLFQRVVEAPKQSFWGHIGMEAVARINYAWALDLQGRTKESEIQLEELQKRKEKAKEMFAHADLQANLMAQRKVRVGECLELRLDVVNVATSSGSILKVEELVPSDGFKVTAVPSSCCLQNRDLDAGKRQVDAFQVETIKLGLQAAKAGVFSLSPQVVYVDDQNKTRTCRPNPVTITVEAASPASKEEDVAGEASAEIEFKSEAAQKAFAFLVNAFVEDHSQRRLTKQRCGWRTLMDIVKQAGVSHYSIYGSGRRGLAVSELERLGVVEVRIFSGERGRGGKITKIRVAYEKENVKHYINQRI